MAPKWSLLPGDCRESLKLLKDRGIFVDSVVTDPPYHLTSIVKRFGGKNAPAKYGTDGAFSRSSAGFMGQSWDGGDIAHDPEFWVMVLDVMKPGAYVAAFSSTRTGHRQACAMEDAGFVMHPMLGWAFGSGFPKAHNAAKAIDKQLGAEGSVVPNGPAVKRMIPGADQNATGSWEKNNGREYQPGEYVPGSSEAEQWLGWAYGGQSLKPAFEPIYLAQKPFSEKNGALNILKHGVGAVNLDGCRVGGSLPKSCIGSGMASQMRKNAEFGFRPVDYYSGQTGFEYQPNAKGRHPANLLHDGSEDVVSMFPGSVESSASRFFSCFPPESDPIFYAPKASKTDRAGSRHPTVKPQSLMQWLCRLITPPGGLILDPFAGSGSTGQAAVTQGFRSIMMEQDETFLQDIRNRMNGVKP